jgi:hypothetical protein
MRTLVSQHSPPPPVQYTEMGLHCASRMRIHPKFVTNRPAMRQYIKILRPFSFLMRRSSRQIDIFSKHMVANRSICAYHPSMLLLM